MNIFLAGATGALGRRLVPRLVERGHEVAGTTRNEAKRGLLERLGARPVVVDALDKARMREAVADTRPDVVVHQLTALSGPMNMRKYERTLHPTNRLRTEATDILLAAARDAGTRRIVAQSFAPLAYARTGGPVKSESDPPDADPPRPAAETVAAIRYLERAVTEADGLAGVALRYGWFYGPGTSIGYGVSDAAAADDADAAGDASDASDAGDADAAGDAGGDIIEAVENCQFAIVGSGSGVWSFIHVDDAAAATVAAIEGDATGVFNVTDDEPAPLREWLPVLAEAIDAPAPRRVPRWLGRLFAGRMAVVMMDEIRGASNEKAKRELGWRPRFASWREGFETGLR